MTCRQISRAGLDLVKHFESFFPKAYWDRTGKCWTIGYGHTGLQHKDGTVQKGRKVSHEEALKLLDYDMNQFEARVAALIKVELMQHEFDALVSFDFNTGGLTLEKGRLSTLARRVNERRMDLAAAQFPLWNKSGGAVLRGLTRRRAAERAMFKGKDWTVFAK
jgi:lysozyme